MTLKVTRTTLLIGSILLLLAAGLGAWLGYNNGVHGRTVSIGVTPDRDRFPIRGIDVSAHNGVIDYERVAADSVDFVIIKATEGTDFKDRMWVDNWRRARKAGLPVGAYHFFRFDAPGDMQALNLLHSLQGRPLDLPVVIDVEQWSNPNDHPTERVIERLLQMVEMVEAHGYRVMVYSNKGGFDKFLRGRIADRDLWICSFTYPPLRDATPWTLWQHTHHGHVDGISGSVDINTFNGSRAQYLRWLSQ